MTSFKWSIIDTGPALPEHNMAIDVQLLESLATHSQPILHLYDWGVPAATYGHFIDPYTLLNKTEVDAVGLTLARRPTGGGVIFHLTDFAFSILVPEGHPEYSLNTLDNYAFVNRLVIQAVERFVQLEAETKVNLSMLPIENLVVDEHAKHFCMGKPTKYDVILDGRKVGGGAQRRTKHGFLHQGTISLAFPDENLLKRVLLPGTRVFEAMKLNTGVLLEIGSTGIVEEARKQFREVFKSIVVEL